MDDHETAELARSLAAMKRSGCWLLVAGRAAGHEHGRACERLLGEADECPRRRVLVEAAPDRADAPGGVGPDATRIAVAGGQVRQTGAVASRPSGGPGVGGPDEGVPRTDLPGLADACVSEVTAIERTADLAPAELRFCVDSLVPLVEANDVDAVASLVETVGERVRAARGMGHVHLPVARDSDAVERLRPLFDAVVEVRGCAGRVEHRWHVRTADVTSGWLEL